MPVSIQHSHSGACAFSKGKIEKGDKEVYRHGKRLIEIKTERGERKRDRGRDWEKERERKKEYAEELVIDFATDSDLKETGRSCILKTHATKMFYHCNRYTAKHAHTPQSLSHKTQFHMGVASVIFKPNRGQGRRRCAEAASR